MTVRHVTIVPMLALLSACGSSAPSPQTAADAPATRHAVVVLTEPAEGAVNVRGATVLSPPPSGPSAAERVAPLLERARTLYRDLSFAESLAAVGEAQRILEQTPVTEADFDALHTALVYRAMNELALQNTHRAREALRAASALRSEQSLDEGRFPPAIRAQHEEVRAILRAEQPVAVAVTTEPSGAELSVDGQPYGEAPGTLHGSPARHYVRVAATGFAARVLAVDFGMASQAPLHVELPPAGLDEAARQVAALDGPALAALSETERDALAEALRAPVAVVAVTADDEWHATRLDLETGETREAHTDAAGAEPAVRALLAQLEPSTAPEQPGEGSLWESPWLWAGVGAVLVGAGVTGAILLTRDPGQQFVVDANP